MYRLVTRPGAEKEKNVLFNDKIVHTTAFVTSVMEYWLEWRKEMFYLTTHSTHLASDMWLRTILRVRKETRCCHIGYSYRLTARVLLYAPSHRQDNTYHSLCYTSRGALAGTRILPDQVVKCLMRWGGGGNRWHCLLGSLSLTLYRWLQTHWSEQSS